MECENQQLWFLTSAVRGGSILRESFLDVTDTNQPSVTFRGWWDDSNCICRVGVVSSDLVDAAGCGLFLALVGLQMGFQNRPVIELIATIGTAIDGQDLPTHFWGTEPCFYARAGQPAYTTLPVSESVLRYTSYPQVGVRIFNSGLFQNKPSGDEFAINLYERITKRCARTFNTGQYPSARCDRDGDSDDEEEFAYV